MIEHTTRAFDADLHELARKIAEMGRHGRNHEEYQRGHLFPEPGALEAVIDHAATWFERYLAPARSLRSRRAPT